MVMNVEPPRSNRSLPQLNKLWRGPVTSHDRQVVSRYPRDAEKDLENYQVEINRMKATILSLEAMQTGLRKTVAKYKGLLAPVHRLTPDILLEIFGNLCDEDGNTLRLAKTPAALTLASIDFSDWEDCGVEGSPRIAKLTRSFLEHSRISSLKIKLVFPWSPGPTHGFDPEPTMDLLRAHSSRWERVEASFSEHFAQSAAGVLKLPNLQHIALHTCHPMWQWPQLAVSDTILGRFANSPSLTSASLDLEGPELRVSLPWAQLRAIELKSCQSGPAFSALALSSNLKHVTLFNVDDRHRPYAGQPVTLNTVRTLSMQTEGNDVRGMRVKTALLRHLNLPSLSSFEMTSNSKRMPLSILSMPSDVIHLQDFITRSACSLASLRLHPVILMDTDLISLLRLTPDLKSLDIGELEGESENWTVTTKFINGLYVPHEASDLAQTTFLPHLAELKLSIHAKRLDEQALSDALTSRWTPSSRCLKTVEIGLMAEDEPQAGPLSLLKCFVDFGLRFTLYHISSATKA
ncbi:hypothetical protein V5O48_004994 [Marasmius crinis-equi]|uniref:F-box domain-containing protein n=1 Tax=Marasmius crinis-equi TaxID=585013 RepID=A0ABR3FNI8_9AGAR